MPSFSQNTSGVAQDRGNSFVTAKAANFTVTSTDVAPSMTDICYDLSLNTTVGVTATIPPNSTFALPIGAKIVFVQGVTGTTVITAGAGVTLVGASATVAASTGRTAIQVVTNKWFLY